MAFRRCSKSGPSFCCTASSSSSDSKKNGMPMTLKASSIVERPQAKKVTMCTFHALCVRILRQDIEKLGYKRNFVIYDEAEQLGAIKKILANISAKGEQTDPRAVLGLLSKFKNGGAQAEAAFKDPNVSALAEHVRKKYESALKACNAVDFDDRALAGVQALGFGARVTTQKAGADSVEELARIIRGHDVVVNCTYGAKCMEILDAAIAAKVPPPSNARTDAHKATQNAMLRSTMPTTPGILAPRTA